MRVETALAGASPDWLFVSDPELSTLAAGGYCHARRLTL